MTQPDSRDPAPVAVPAAQPMNPGDEAPAGTPGTGENVCPACAGSGRVDGAPCTECAGSGRVVSNVGDA